MTNLLEQISNKTKKSQNIILFEFMQDTHPRIFKHMLEREKSICNSATYPHNRPTHYISLINNILTELPLPQKTIEKFNQYYNKKNHS